MSLLNLHQVSVGYGPFRVIHDVSASFERGEFVSLIGPNGAGKTTLLSAISGQLPVQSGRLEFEGNDITKTSVPKRARLGMGRSFQTANSFNNLSVLENVALACEGRRNVSLFELFHPLNRTSVNQAVRLLEQVALLEEAEKPAHLLSHGDKRKLEIAMLLALRPKVLLLDEPTAGMAHAQVPMITEMIERLRDTREYTILFVEHKMDVVLRLSDRVLVLQQGRLLLDGAPRDVIESEVVQQAYLGGGHDSVATVT